MRGAIESVYKLNNKEHNKRPQEFMTNCDSKTFEHGIGLSVWNTKTEKCENN